MSKKLIDCYKEWMEAGKLPDEGLCLCLPKKYKKTLIDIAPTNEESMQLRKEGKPTAYWGYGKQGWIFANNYYTDFTPLRQAIVLLICAMHDEI